MHDGMPYGRNQGQGQGHSREVDRQSPTGLIFILYFFLLCLVFILFYCIYCIICLCLLEWRINIIINIVQ